MILTLDVGNSQIYGGVFDGDQIKLRFRRTSKTGASSDEFGIFLRSVLRENGLDPALITQVAVCTVVPEVLHSLKNACVKYFGRNPFVLQAGVKTGLKIRYKNPLEVGADRIANAIAATHIYPDKNILIVDFGTATTFCALNSEKEYLGGAITAGLKISMQALESQTSKLPSVEIIPREECLARSTMDSIQSGLYFGTIGQFKEIRDRISKEAFAGQKPIVIGTGGFASLFDKENLFDQENPDLVLRGLHLALKMNT
jgi:type III pantothenate kinase